MMLFFLWFIPTLANVPEYQIQTNESARIVHWDGISVDKDIVYVNPKGLNLLNFHQINYTMLHVDRVVQNSKTIRQLKCFDSSLCREFVIGKSVNGIDIKGARLTNFTRLGELSLRILPEFKWVGNMHGDETVGRELLIRLIEDIQKNSAHILNEIDIYIIPSMNPDGFRRGTRSNANGQDLNRNFPDRFGWNYGSIQPETRAMMNWMKGRNFVMGANLHGGDIVANYPWDGNRARRSGRYSASPDDPTFRAIASVYARYHEKMKRSREFPGGIVNGASWYVLYGGMQDWTYIHTNNLEITLELSYPKHPIHMDPYWNDNKLSMYKYMDCLTKMGIHGTSDHPVIVNGHRILKAGSYHAVLSMGNHTLYSNGKTVKIYIPPNQQILETLNF